MTQRCGAREVRGIADLRELAVVPRNPEAGGPVGLALEVHPVGRREALLGRQRVGAAHVAPVHLLRCGEVTRDRRRLHGGEAVCRQVADARNVSRVLHEVLVRSVELRRRERRPRLPHVARVAEEEVRVDALRGRGLELIRGVRGLPVVHRVGDAQLRRARWPPQGLEVLAEAVLIEVVDEDAAAVGHGSDDAGATPPIAGGTLQP
mmetsp:Transcript_17128/g.48028  ORF Transcript_17128/g.48028 Transcript_17128/m.48028 type:complete len:206 (+) Transcript_17128:342-959(+)